VLVDWLAWAQSQNKQVDTPDQGYKIPVSDLVAVLKHQDTELQKGDILIVRTGFLKWYDSQEEESEREEHQKKGSPSLGLDASEEMVNWLWSKHFAAVAADNPALEAWPPSSELQKKDLLSMH
jgi:kynurenine formamidase